MNALALAGLPGGWEVIIILFVLLLLFGGKKLPELSRSIGRSLGEFKKGKQDLEQEIKDVQDDFQKAADEVDVEEKKQPDTVPEKEQGETPETP